MSLFVGNVSSSVSKRELQDLFEKYGKCRIDLKRGFMFVDYDDEAEANAALESLQGKVRLWVSGRGGRYLCFFWRSVVCGSVVFLRFKSRVYVYIYKYMCVSVYREIADKLVETCCGKTRNTV